MTQQTSRVTPLCSAHWMTCWLHKDTVQQVLTCYDWSTPTVTLSACRILFISLSLTVFSSTSSSCIWPSTSVCGFHCLRLLAYLFLLYPKSCLYFCSIAVRIFQDMQKTQQLALCEYSWTCWAPCDVGKLFVWLPVIVCWLPGFAILILQVLAILCQVKMWHESTMSWIFICAIWHFAAEGSFCHLSCWCKDCLPSVL